MGIYSGTAPLVDIAGISAEMQTAVEAWQNGIVRIVDPNISDGDYDPWTNATAGGAPSTMWEGSARIQPIRSATAISGTYENISIRGVRFQIPLRAQLSPDLAFREGLQIIVIDGGMFPDLEKFQYVITNGINSSFAWNRTIEASVDLGATEDS